MTGTVPRFSVGGMASHGIVAANPGMPGDLRDLIALCDMVFGRELTAYLAGAASVGQLASWVAHGAGTRAPLRRLRVVAEIIYAFAANNRVSAAGPWLRYARGGRPSPARAIRGLGEDDVQARDIVDDAATFAAH